MLDLKREYICVQEFCFVRKRMYSCLIPQCRNFIVITVYNNFINSSIKLNSLNMK